MIGRNGERRSGISAQTARHDDDDIYNGSLKDIMILISKMHIYIYIYIIVFGKM